MRGAGAPTRRTAPRSQRLSRSWRASLPSCRAPSWCGNQRRAAAARCRDPGCCPCAAAGRGLARRPALQPAPHPSITCLHCLHLCCRPSCRCSLKKDVAVCHAAPNPQGRQAIAACHASLCSLHLLPSLHACTPRGRLACLVYATDAGLELALYARPTLDHLPAPLDDHNTHLHCFALLTLDSS